MHPLISEDPCRAIQEVVTRLEFEARCRRDIDTRFSGTTLAMIIIQETRVISVNIGDSRVVLGTRNSEGCLIARPLSSDHKPDEFGELNRIIYSGGRVYRTSSPLPISLNSTSNDSRLPRVWGPARVWLKDVDAPGLAMSRSLCDDVIHTAGVISTLDFHEHYFDHLNDCVLIIGTDGLWQYISNQEAVDIAVKEKEPSKASVRFVLVLFRKMLISM